MSDKKFEVGQEVWFEPSDPREKGRNCTVKKVGRIYYEISYGCSSVKVDIDTKCRCEYPCGELYNSEKEARDCKRARDLWLGLRNKCFLKPSLEQVEKIYEILGVDLKK